MAGTTDDRVLEPEFGVRVSMRREVASGDDATYVVTAAIADRDPVELRVELRRGEAPHLEGGSPMPAWVERIVVAIARSMCKNNQWPRRVTRWKAAPEGVAPRG